ncbi:MAG: hypothetical protein AAB150_08195, partial [Pseudomonadota bacterium]
RDSPATDTGATMLTEHALAAALRRRRFPSCQERNFSVTFLQWRCAYDEDLVGRGKSDATPNP